MYHDVHASFAIIMLCQIDNANSEQDFGGRGGYWKLTYHDDDLRILYSGQGNIFVLQRATS